MPTRLLYEKICTSATLAQLTAEEERFFYRLMVQCDDFGRFHADPVILRNRCFQRQEDIQSVDVRVWRDRLEHVGLIRVYEVSGEAYLVMLTFDGYQRQRASKPKYPDPPTPDSNPPQLAASSGDMPLARRQDTLPGLRKPVAGSRKPEAGTHLNPPAEREDLAAGAARGERPRSLPDDVRLALARLPRDGTAAQFHDAVEAALVGLGFTCQREVVVDDRGDGQRGRLDLVAERAGERIAFELDAATPRAKSVAKLVSVPDAVRVIVLRSPSDRHQTRPHGIDEIIAPSNGIRANGSRDPPPKLEPGEEWIEPGHPEYSSLVGRYKRVRV